MNAMKKNETAAERLRAAAKERGYEKASDLATAIGMKEPTVRSLMNGIRNLTAAQAEKFGNFLGVEEAYLLYGRRAPELSTRSASNSRKYVAETGPAGVDSFRGHKHTDIYKSLSERVHVIGKVQAGAWMEAYQLPEPEWKEMRLPQDHRFPGITRYALENDGESMNRVCRHGGVWVFVRFQDLVGQGPQQGNYVIVERWRKDGLVEATAKMLKLDARGRPMLHPDSTDPSFQPIALNNDDEADEIRVIGLVTDIINKV